MIPRVFCLSGLVLLSSVGGLAASLSRGNARVLVDSVATVAYRERQAQRGPDDIETYNVIEGRFHPGTTRDGSLRRVTFQTVVDTLAENMAKRNYFPSADYKAADLLLVVHYGVTAVEEDWEDLMGITSPDEEAAASGDYETEGNAEGGTDFSLVPHYNNLGSAQHGDAHNAQLLGIDRQLNRQNLTASEEWHLRDILEDERYFIIVMAYDFPHLVESGELDLLWSTRFSVRSPGINFEEAHFALSRAAAPFFGTHLEKLAWKRAPMGETEVDIGEIEVVESDVE